MKIANCGDAAGVARTSPPRRGTCRSRRSRRAASRAVAPVVQKKPEDAVLVLGLELATDRAGRGARGAPRCRGSTGPCRRGSPVVVRRGAAGQRREVRRPRFCSCSSAPCLGPAGSARWRRGPTHTRVARRVRPREQALRDRAEAPGRRAMPWSQWSIDPLLQLRRAMPAHGRRDDAPFCPSTAAACLAACLAVTRDRRPAPRLATGDDEITFVGHGWGHGRGMGQYGALGYAVDHGKSYSGSSTTSTAAPTAGDVGNPEMTVELLGLTGKPLVVTGAHVYVHAAGVERLSTSAPPRGSPCCSDGHVRVEKASGCAPEATGGSWQVVSDNGTYSQRPPGCRPPAGASAVAELLRVCEAARRARLPRRAVGGRGAARLADDHQPPADRGLPAGASCRGRARRAGAAWAAARAWRPSRRRRSRRARTRCRARRPSGAKTCDTTSCQVYGGAGILAGAAGSYLEDARTNAAIAATAGRGAVRAGRPPLRCAPSSARRPAAGPPAGPSPPSWTTATPSRRTPTTTGRRRSPRAQVAAEARAARGPARHGHVAQRATGTSAGGC